MKIDAGLRNMGMEPVLRSGIQKAGIELPITTVFSWGHSDREVLRPNLCLENGLFNDYSEKDYGKSRRNYLSVCWNDTHNWGFWKYPITVERPLPEYKPWKMTNKPKTAVVLLQAKGDYALRDCKDYVGWSNNIREQAEKHFEKVLVKQHPLRPYEVKKHDNLTLDEAIEVADVGITWSSTAGVDFLLAGIPVIFLGTHSMATELSSSFYGLQYPDREAWLRQVMMCQWRREEIEDGSMFSAIPVGDQAYLMRLKAERQ